MAVSFRPAVRENVGLIIGLAGSSGSGKTYSAMRLAAGIAGDNPFAVIDTEGGRAKHYADRFRFDHADLHAPFTPEAYAEAIELADKARYPAIVVDSMSHEWAGDGGVLDMQEAEFARMGHGDNVKMASWIKPKGRHKRMVQQLLQCRAHLILCFRAEEKIDMIKEGGKTKIVPKEGPGGFKGWLPICEKNMPYELIVSFLMHFERPGIGVPIKPLQEQLRPLFPDGALLDERAGQGIAAWAKGDTPATGLKTAQETRAPSEIRKVLSEAATRGTAALRGAWAAWTPGPRTRSGTSSPACGAWRLTSTRRRPQRPDHGAPPAPPSPRRSPCLSRAPTRAAGLG